jgi:hypothetical protein
MEASRKGEDKRRKVRRYQQKLGETRVLLLQLKARPGASQTIKDDINHDVEELEQIERELPDLVNSPDFSEVVYDFLKKVRSIWRSIRSG